MMRAHLPIVLAFLGALAAPATARQEVAQPAVRYAALPLRDLSGETAAAARLHALLREALAARGAAFVREEELERLLYERRIRYIESIGHADARALGAALAADFLLTGSLLSYLAGPVPQLALTVRVLDLTTGERIQSVLVSLRGDDFRGLFGLGAIDDVRDLELEAVARVLEEFDEAARPRSRRTTPRQLACARPADALGRFTDAAFRSADLERLVVMPLDNGTNRSDAGLLFSEILAHQWSRAGVQVIETSELRAALVRARVRSIEFLDHETLAAIGRDLGVRYFLLGRLDLFSERVFREDGYLPEVEASVRLLDVQSGRIVAAASVRRRGDDSEGLLGLGVVHDLVQLADRTARELVALILT